MSQESRVKKIVEGTINGVPSTRIAKAIVKELKEDSKSGSSTWGDKFPEAHKELFETYYDDIMDSVEYILGKYITKEN